MNKRNEKIKAVEEKDSAKVSLTRKDPNQEDFIKNNIKKEINTKFKKKN